MFTRLWRWIVLKVLWPVMEEFKVTEVILTSEIRAWEVETTRLAEAIKNLEAEMGKNEIALGKMAHVIEQRIPVNWDNVKPREPRIFTHTHRQ